tara:strand:- start:176 stop:631 length:456 start_codon:yes stop_codon:yes gene_type:complete
MTKLVDLTSDHFGDLYRIAMNMRQEATLYGNHKLDPSHIINVLTLMLESPEFFSQGSISDHRLVGVMLGAVQPEMWTQARVGVDIIWYVAPEARGGPAGLKLIRQFEKWCKSKGAEYIQMEVKAGIDNDRVGELYQRLGYQPAGGAYIKEA